MAAYFFTDVLKQLGVNPGIIPIGAPIAMLAAGYFIYPQRNGWAFIMNALAILFAASTIFLDALPARVGIQPEPGLEPDHL